MGSGERITLYITTQGSQLRRVGDSVRVVRDGEELARHEADVVERVLVFGSVNLTTPALALLAEAGLDVALFSTRGQFRARLVAPANGNAFLRLAQHARHASAEYRTEFARALVSAKLASSRAVLLRYGRRHPQTELGAAAEAIAELRRSVSESDSMERIMGLEGAAAAAYFAAFGRMLPEPFQFERRSTHPAHNEPNALLNLGYTLVGNEIAARLEASGFDPQVGLYHGIRYGRQSLSLDLLEEHRAAVVDRLTLSLLNRRVFGPEDFTLSPSLGVRLTPPALRRYLHHYEAAMGDRTACPTDARVPPPRARIQAQTSRFRDAVMDGTPYEPWSLPT